jgi:hypothetical protein
MNLIVIFMTCTCIVMHSLFWQLPNYNLFTQHVISLWRDTSSELWTPVHSFTLIISSTASTVYFPQVLFYFTANKHLFPHHTSNPLFSANQWDWQPHCKLGQSSLVVLCTISTLLLTPRLPRTRLFSGALPKSASNNFQKWFLYPTGRLNLGFILRENLLLCSSYLSLGFSQLVLWDITTTSSHRTRRAPPSPPAPHGDDKWAIASLHWPDHGPRQYQGWHGLHTADCYTCKHQGPGAIPPSRPPQPLNHRISGPPPRRLSPPRSWGNRLATFSSSHALPSKAAARHRLGGPTAQG